MVCQVTEIVPTGRRRVGVQDYLDTGVFRKIYLIRKGEYILSCLAGVIISIIRSPVMTGLPSHSWGSFIIITSSSGGGDYALFDLVTGNAQAGLIHLEMILQGQQTTAGFQIGNGFGLGALQF